MIILICQAGITLDIAALSLEIHTLFVMEHQFDRDLKLVIGVNFKIIPKFAF